MWIANAVLRFEMSDRLKIMVQHILPKQWLTRLAGHIARGQHGAMTTALIRWFVRRYGVDVREADNAEVGGTRGREALERLENVVKRVGASWRPASAG